LDLRSKINGLEKRLSEKISALEKLVKNFDEMEKEFKQKSKVLSLKEEELKRFQHQVEANNMTIQDLEKDLSVKVTLIENLKKKCTFLEEKIDHSDEVNNIIDKLNEVMEHKGFISEKELEDLKQGKSLYEFSS